MAGTVMATPICTTDRDHPVQSDSPVQIKCCFALSCMKSKKWKKEQDPPGLSKSGGLHLCPGAACAENAGVVTVLKRGSTHRW
jgi:hypothetical protein